ncbi:ferredoxin [Prolixibacter sp. NT017]|uniref:ferredoxin n=1 Tax=Prolixibacter sp. NT017 TaxID=2652390 RepID=UPI001273FBBE|nr:ferredoxin [Prolixibacter sp. NT017]GET25895.1 hypothetical protein NT017_22240 [Prolixibacter sp. NT017]
MSNEPMEYNGYCICVKCDLRLEHKKGMPCREVKCPKCGRTMLKEGSYHHQLYQQKFIDNRDQDEQP